MQLFLDRGYGMQLTPADLELQGVLSKMYTAPRGAPLYPNLSGVGCADQVALIQQCGGAQQCDPRDSNCVANNQYIEDWVGNLFQANYPCIPDGTPCPTLPSQSSITQAFMDNMPLSPAVTGTTDSSGNLANSNAASICGPGFVWQWAGGGALDDPAQGIGGSCVAAPSASTPTPTPAATVATATTPPKTPVTPMATNISNTGATLAANTAPPASGSTAAASTGNWFTDPTQEIISRFPNWGLLAAAGLGLFLMMGDKK